jgi:hypothetical protein
MKGNLFSRFSAPDTTNSTHFVAVAMYQTLLYRIRDADDLLCLVLGVNVLVMGIRLIPGPFHLCLA